MFPAEWTPLISMGAGIAGVISATLALRKNHYDHVKQIATDIVLHHQITCPAKEEISNKIESMRAEFREDLRHVNDRLDIIYENVKR